MTRSREASRSEPLSSVSTAASVSTFSSIRSASRKRCSARPSGPRAAQAGNAWRAASTAASTSARPPRAMSARGLSSIGERSANDSTDPTRSPPMKWSGETSTPATVAVAVLISPPGWGMADPPPASSVRRQSSPVCDDPCHFRTKFESGSRGFLRNGEGNVAGIRRVLRLGAYCRQFVLGLDDPV